MPDKEQSLLITPQATLSFPWFITAQPPMEGSPPGTKGKYGTMLVFSKAAQATPEYKAIISAVAAAAQENWGAKGIQMLKVGQLHNPIGTDWAKKNLPEGSAFIQPRSGKRPGLVLRDLTEVLDEEQIEAWFYPGAQARAEVSVFTFDKGVKKGVSIGLNNVQFLAHGPRLDSRKPATKVFDALPELEPSDISDITGAAVGSEQDPY